MDKKIPGSLHIAVTGHRFIPKAPELNDSIRQVFHVIMETHKPQAICLYSALAEGSDQLAVEIAQELENINLCVPLPLPIEQYLEGFSSEEGRISFHKLLSTADHVINLLPSANHLDSYQALGAYLVNQGDILLALWNGVYNRKKGGTSEVIKAALRANKPVYWVYCHNQKLGEDNFQFPQKQIGDMEILLSCK